MEGSPIRTVLAMLLAVPMLLGGTGCIDQRLAEERANYDAQNRELQDELLRARTALDQLRTENDRLAGELANRATPIPADSNQFAGIDDIEVIQGDDRVTVRLPGDVLFASGKIELRSSAKTTLGQVADVIRREYPGQTVRVEGYTDTDPIVKSKWKDNLELSLQRAAAVHRHLVSQGLEANEMYAAGFGEARPRGSKEKSRRVEIVVVDE
ncbi:MAG: OmpA family protein [Planctomycetota bacterium]